jgi:hypothetical protein
LIEDLPKLVSLLGFNEGKLTINPTFNYSWIVGGADAQGIFAPKDSPLIPQQRHLLDIKTSLKREPVTEDQIYQQLGYFLLDDSIHNLSHLSFLFSRHGIVATYPISMFLTKNIETTEEEFEEWAIEIESDHDNSKLFFLGSSLDF